MDITFIFTYTYVYIYIYTHIYRNLRSACATNSDQVRCVFCHRLSARENIDLQNMDFTFLRAGKWHYDLSLMHCCGRLVKSSTLAWLLKEICLMDPYRLEQTSKTLGHRNNFVYSVLWTLLVRRSTAGEIIYPYTSYLQLKLKDLHVYDENFGVTDDSVTKMGQIMQFVFARFRKVKWANIAEATQFHDDLCDVRKAVQRIVKACRQRRMVPSVGWMSVVITSAHDAHHTRVPQCQTGAAKGAFRRRSLGETSVHDALDTITQ